MGYDNLRQVTTGKSQVVTAESCDWSQVVTGSRTTDCGRGQVFGHVKPGHIMVYDNLRQVTTAYDRQVTGGHNRVVRSVAGGRR